MGVRLSLDSIGTQSIIPGKTLTIQLNAILTNNESTIIYSGSNLPEGAEVEALSGEFTWEPTPSDVGTHTVTLTARAAGLTDSETIEITVDPFAVFIDLIMPDTVVVSAADGAIVTVDTGGVYTKTKVLIFPNTLPGDRTIIIKAPDAADISADEINMVPSATDFVVVGSESGFTFDDDINVIIEYKDFEIENEESNMRVHVWDALLKIWKRVRGIQIVDIVNNTVTVITNHFSIFGVLEIDEAAEETEIGIGWNMVSIPLDPDEIDDPREIFADDIKSFRFEDKNSNIYEYNEVTNAWNVPSAIENGTGYILWGFKSGDVDIDGFAETGDISHSLSFTNSNGWHLLGNPYSVSVDWDTDMTLGAGISTTYYRWTGSGYKFYPGGGLTAAIAPWEGFFVNTSVDGESFDITYPGVSKRSHTDENILDWRIRFIAESGTAQDSHTYIGISDLASAEYDEFDKYELASLNNEFVSVYFPHTTWSLRPGNYTQDIRAMHGSSLEWTMAVAARSSSGTVTLNWTLPDEVDSDYDIALNNNRTQEEINMRERTSYTFTIPAVSQKSSSEKLAVNPDPSDLTAKLSQDGTHIEYFTVTLSKAENEESVNIPTTFYLNQNYPNPFNPSTTIEYGLPQSGHVELTVFNALGQKVLTLVNEDQPAGIQRVVWNGTNDRGIRVASGMYLYRIKANGTTNIKRLLLIK